MLADVSENKATYTHEARSGGVNCIPVRSYGAQNRVCGKVVNAAICITQAVYCIDTHLALLSRLSYTT